MLKQAVITAGGRGERLRPLTDSIPKVMISLAGKPLLEHHVEQFKKYGVTEFFFTLFYLPEKIKEYFGNGDKWGVKIYYFIEQEPLGDMGGLRAFQDKLENNFFFIWGDMYSEVNYVKLAEYYKNLTNPIGLERVQSAEYKPEADFVGLDQNMKLNGIYPKYSLGPGMAEVYRLRGAAIFSKEIFSFFPEEGPFSKNKLLTQILEKNENFYGYECEEYSKGIDTKEKYAEVEKHIASSNG